MSSAGAAETTTTPSPHGVEEVSRLPSSLKISPPLPPSLPGGPTTSQPATKYVPPALRGTAGDARRSPSYVELSDERRTSGYPEQDLHRSYESVGDFRRYREGPPSLGGGGGRDFSNFGGRRGSAPVIGGGGAPGGGPRGGHWNAADDRWARFHDSRRDEDRRERREAWLKQHAEEIRALEDALAEQEDPYADMVIDVTGDGAPTEYMERFVDVDLGEALDSNILKAKYARPMPVQRTAIPIVLAGRDLMACAQTGSGKTAAFLFPMISKILYAGTPQVPPEQAQHMARGSRQRAYPRALILAPTRELASQIYDEAAKFSLGTPLRPVVVYGGADVYFQMRELERGCDILVATPGRLVDLLERVRVSLCCVQWLVLDEADRMLDMGFEPQIRHIVEREDLTLTNARQTLMFSATFPKEIQRLAQDFLKDYLFLTVGRTGSTVSNILQHLVHVESESERRSAVVDLLRAHTGLTLVFVETKKSADCMEAFLAGEGFPVTSIHGDRTQSEREDALRAFKSHDCTVLVATDVAARGLDIPNVLHVINYDMPQDINNYVHRIGRTGRARKAGLATSFVGERNKMVLPELLQLMEETAQEIPDWFIPLMRSCGARGGSGGGGRGRRGGGGGGSRFGGRSTDLRKDHHREDGGGSYGGGQRSGGGAGAGGRRFSTPPGAGWGGSWDGGAAASSSDGRW